MRLYIKGNYTKEILFDYRYLAKKMWFEIKDGKELDISYIGYTNVFRTNPSISLQINKWTHDERWNHIVLEKTVNNILTSHKYEYINLDFEDSYISDYREKGDHLRIASTHRDLLTVDRRAMLIMAIEVATAIDGQISEDDKATWLSVEEFKEHHKETLSLSFEVANEMSLNEIQTLEAIPDPIWAEDDRRYIEYIEKYGEADYEDEE